MYRLIGKTKTTKDTIAKDAITITLGYRSETPNELAGISSHPTERRTRRKILYERTKEDDSPVFPKAEFEEMMN